MEFTRYKIGNCEIDPDEDSQVVVMEDGKLTPWASNHWKWIQVYELEHGHPPEGAEETIPEQDSKDIGTQDSGDHEGESSTEKSRTKKRTATVAGLETN